MNWHDLFSLEALKRHFDWTPVAVKTPRPKYKYYNDVGRVLLGYEVEVEYLYHGKRAQLFVSDEEKLGIVSRQLALANAISFYRRTKLKISEYKKGKQQCK